MSVGLIILSQTISTTVPVTTLWLGMLITGIGIGPTLSVYTIVVQNAVPFSKLGVATSNLTFFRQIGGSVGLAIAGTVFANALSTELPKKLTPIVEQIASTAPPAVAAQITAGFQQNAANLDLNNLTGVGQSFGTALISAVPAAIQPLFAPFKDALDTAFYDAFSFGVAQTFLMGVVTGLAALICSLFIRELALRNSFGPETAPAAAGAPSAEQRVATAPSVSASSPATSSAATSSTPVPPAVTWRETGCRGFAAARSVSARHYDHPDD